jgi:hypothetical protein
VSRHWFNSQWIKPNIATMALAQDGIALRLAPKPAQMLSVQSFTHRDYQAVFDTLQQHKNLLANQKIKLIISNHFMRFAVLPWQDGVYSRKDWLALANHTFRQQFGAVADNWQLKVSLGAYGQGAIASAMDRTLYDGLMDISQQLDFSWHAIEPLAMRLLNQSRRDEAAWILIAEPQHLLLCETQHGQFQRFSVASPPAGQEATFATQMITRAKLQLPSQQQPKHTVLHVSGKLNDSWLNESNNKENLNADHLKLVFAKQRHLHHAGWLVNL